MTDPELMAHALRYAANSPDPSTQNGALLATPDGVPLWDTVAWNTFPFGVDRSEVRWERPAKYTFVEHAERNAIYAAARHGISTSRLTLVCPWAACADCARAIIQSRIDRLITLAPERHTTHARWDESIEAAMTMLSEAEVTVTYLEDPIPGPLPTLRRNGEPWSVEEAAS